MALPLDSRPSQPISLEVIGELRLVADCPGDGSPDSAHTFISDISHAEGSLIPDTIICFQHNIAAPVSHNYPLLGSGEH